MQYWGPVLIPAVLVSNQSANVIAVVLSVFLLELVAAWQFGQLHNLLVLVGP